MTPAEITQAREAANLTTGEAAALCYLSRRAWQHYEAGTRHMPERIWHLFRMQLRNTQPQRKQEQTK